MDESLIRGLFQGLMLAIIGISAALFWKLIRSKSEVARRFKLVALAGLGLCVLALVLDSAGLVPTLITAAVIAALVWVYRGRNQKN